MSESTSGGKQNEQPSRPATTTEADAAATAKQDKSSHDHMSREKAGSDQGAGGGAKQEQKH